jgi:hypothetical protein
MPGWQGFAAGGSPSLALVISSVRIVCLDGLLWPLYGSWFAVPIPALSLSSLHLPISDCLLLLTRSVPSTALYITKNSYEERTSFFALNSLRKALFLFALIIAAILSSSFQAIDIKHDSTFL